MKKSPTAWTGVTYRYSPGTGQMVVTAAVSTKVDQVAIVQADGVIPVDELRTLATIAVEDVRRAYYGPIEDLLFKLEHVIGWYRGETGDDSVQGIYDDIWAYMNTPAEKRPAPKHNPVSFLTSLGILPSDPEVVTVVEVYGDTVDDMTGD